jgi:hypothetical protein
MQVNQEDLTVVTDFQTTVENDKESLSHNVNRRGEDQLKIGLGHIFALAHGENDVQQCACSVDGFAELSVCA